MSSETALKALMQERMVELYTYWQHWKKQSNGPTAHYQTTKKDVSYFSKWVKD